MKSILRHPYTALKRLMHLPHRALTSAEQDRLAQKRGLELESTLDLGFHGDTYLLVLVDYFLTRCTNFIETGAFAGTTARYTATTYPGVQVYSCEPDATAYEIASARCQAFSNIHLHQQSSPQFLYDLFRTRPELANAVSTFWLDAHGYGFEWPLVDEITFITQNVQRAFILIDDFQIPDNPAFQYCSYDGMDCSFEYIAGALAPGRAYSVISPVYSEHTSQHHPLVGVGIIVVGVDNLELPTALQRNFSVMTLSR